MAIKPDLFTASSTRRLGWDGNKRLAFDRVGGENATHTTTSEEVLSIIVESGLGGSFGLSEVFEGFPWTSETEFDVLFVTGRTKLGHITRGIGASTKTASGAHVKIVKLEVIGEWRVRSWYGGQPRIVGIAATRCSCVFLLRTSSES